MVNYCQSLAFDHPYLSCNAVFFIWIKLWVLKKAPIKIVAHAIYTSWFFLIHTLLFWWKIKTSFDCCFPQQTRPQITVQLYILQDYSGARIVFNVINKHHTLAIMHCVSLNLLSLIHERDTWKRWYMQKWF